MNQMKTLISKNITPNKENWPNKIAGICLETITAKMEDMSSLYLGGKSLKASKRFWNKNNIR